MPKTSNYLQVISLLIVAFGLKTLAYGFPRVDKASWRREVRGVDIDQKLLAALIRVESDNNPSAIEKRTGARGLTQIRQDAWDDLVRNYPAKYGKLNYKRDIFRPDVAREAGKDYLNLVKFYLAKRNIPVNLDNVLAAYNWGIGNLERLGLFYTPQETKVYIRKIRLCMAGGQSG